MTTNTNTIPAPVTKVELSKVNIEDVVKGDTIASGAQRDVNVGQVKVGTKWVELRSGAGTLLIRAERGTEVTIAREVETEESRNARHRANKNAVIRRFMDSREVNQAQLKVLAELTEQAEKGYYADSFKMTALLAAQADDKINDSFAAFVTNNVGREFEDGSTIIDEVAAYEAFKEELVERLTGRGYDLTRGLSRCTSMASNLMDDAEREAIVNFIRDSYRFI